MSTAILKAEPPQAQKGDRRNKLAYGRFLAPAAARPSAAFEVVIGMLLAMGICYWVRPSDPLLLGLGYPWVWLAATVFALRYGALLGVLAGLCIAAGWFWFYSRSATAVFPMLFFAGGLMQVLIAGHFGDIWASRANRLQAVNNYLNDRLVSITNNHYLLRISHERLEKDLLSKPSTLRDGLSHLRALSTAADSSGPLPNAQAMLEFAALSCQIGSASIFAASGHGFGPQPVASVGDQFELDGDDPLLVECLEKRALTHLRQVETARTYLACVPIIAASGHMAGVMVVRRMPFLSLNFDNLQLLLVLLNYYADGIEQQALVAPIQHAVDQCPYDFALELGRLAHMGRVSGISSSLVGMVFPRGTISDSLFDQVVRQRRTLDMLWAFGTERAQVVMVLMPLTDEHGVDGHLLRIENSLKTQFDIGLAQAHVAVHSAAVDARMPGRGLGLLLKRCISHD